MPSLTLDTPTTYSPAQKRAFAERLGAVYAETMETDLETITVVVHDGGEGAVWRCTAEGPVAGAMLMCDIRRGRPAEQRERLCRRMVDVCEAVLAIAPATLKIEFTQHAGDEMFHPHLRGFNTEWSGSDAAANKGGERRGRDSNPR